MADRDALAPEVRALGLPGLFLRAVSRHADAVAAAFPGERWTYGQLWRAAEVVADRLVQAGIRPGEHVGLLLPNSGKFLATLIGAGLAGAVPVPLNTRYRADELPYVIEHADLVALVTVCGRTTNGQGEVVDYPSRLAEALPGLHRTRAGGAACAEAPLLRLAAGFGSPLPDWLVGWPSPSEEPVSPGPAPGVRPWPGLRPPLGPDDIALMLYTSGTTSRPKGVRLSHGALLHGAVFGVVDRLGTGQADVVWSPAPLCHVGSITAFLGTFAVGAEFVSAPWFDVDGAIQLLEAERVTIAFAGFPAFYLDLGNRLRATGRELPALAVLTTAASPWEIERIRDLFPAVRQVSVTGSTELGGSICVSDAGDSPAQRATTAGRPIEGVELSIRDERGLPVPDGATGELWVRGPCLLSAYHKDPAPLLTGEPDGGWFRTGDLGTVVDGRFGFRGRLKDMVKVGGENVAAAEVEDFLLRHPAIVRAQVVGAADRRLGEVVAAFVELAPGCDLSEPEVVAYCRGAMAAYKVPRMVRFLTEWPMSATKVSKPALRAMLAPSVSR